MRDLATSVAALLGLSINVVAAGGGIAAILLVGSIIRWISLQRVPRDERNKRLKSLGVWWGMYGLVAATLVAGPVGGGVTFCIVSLIGLWEYSNLLSKKSLDRTGFWILFVSVPICYASVLDAGDNFWATVALVAAVMGVTIRLVVAGTTAGFLATSSRLIWGHIIAVFCLSHAALLLALPASTNRVAGSAGWLVYLLLFTECDDIFQALWGRRFGRRKIAPQVSPNKTWEGFVLGGLTAMGIGILFAPVLTPLAEPWAISLGGQTWQLPYAGALAAGGLLVVAGFFGDLNMSALKRDLGVKDTGDWLPSQGGILDRIDSLTFTAPALYYFVRIAYD